MADSRATDTRWLKRIVKKTIRFIRRDADARLEHCAGRLACGKVARAATAAARTAAARSAKVAAAAAAIDVGAGAGVGDTAAPTALPASADPLVRAVAWTCAEQDCEGLPIIAYDNLPASNADGTAIAFVEERDGWGHVPKPGLRLKFVDGHMQFLPTTGVRGAKYASPAAERAAHQRAIDAANSEVHGKGFVALLPMVRAVQAAAGIVNYVAAGAALSFNYKSKQDMPDASPEFSELVVTQDGKEVARRPGKDFPDQAGCSQRKLVVEGVRPERKVIGLTFTNGLTGHNCDGKAEPQVHYVLRWQ